MGNEPMILIFLFLLSVLIVELSLEINWDKTIFTKGIILYTEKFRMNTTPSIQHLEKEFGGNWAPKIHFKKLDDETIYFREPIISFEFKLNPPLFMRGLIITNKSENCFYIKGLANFFPIVFSLTLIAILFLQSDSDWYNKMGGTVIVCLIYLVSYFFQMSQLRRVGNFLTRN